MSPEPPDTGILRTVARAYRTNRWYRDRLYASARARAILFIRAIWAAVNFLFELDFDVTFDLLEVVEKSVLLEELVEVVSS